MQLTPEEREEKIRPLVTAGLSTRGIEQVTGIPQSTVVRDIKRINTGENPILAPDQEKPVKTIRRWPLVIGITVSALLILAVAIGAVTFLRNAPTRETGYAPIFQYPAPANRAVYLCVGVTLEGYVSDLAPATGKMCPRDWKLLKLPVTG